MNAFKLFLSSFETVAIDQDHFATLTIVFASEQTNETSQLKNLKELVSDFQKRANFQKVNVINVPSSGGASFSRAKLLDIGVDKCCDHFDTARRNENLLFFCDVDVLFNQNFLHMCRYNAIRGRRAFFPILYSFYNPKNIKSLVNNTSFHNVELDSADDDDVETDDDDVETGDITEVKRPDC